MPFRVVRIANASIGESEPERIKVLFQPVWKESMAEAACFIVTCLINGAILLVSNTAFAVKIRIDPIPPFLGVFSLMLQPLQHLFI